MHEYEQHHIPEDLTPQDHPLWEHQISKQIQTPNNLSGYTYEFIVVSAAETLQNVSMFKFLYEYQKGANKWMTSSPLSVT